MKGDPDPQAARQSIILVVDDDIDILLPLVQLLQEALPTAKVFPAISPEEAFEFASDRRIDLVISDQKMPGMTGEHLLGLLRTQPGHPAGILITGYPDDGLAYRARTLSKAVVVLAKPFDVLDLLAEVRAILARRTPHRRSRPSANQ